MNDYREQLIHINDLINAKLEKIIQLKEEIIDLEFEEKELYNKMLKF